MDNVKLILVLVILLLDVVACSKKREQAPECKPYASAYEVEFPDNSIRKSDVSYCNGLFKATDLDQGQATIESQVLTIQLKDATTGTPYLTTFTGQ